MAFTSMSLTLLAVAATTWLASGETKIEPPSPTGLKAAEGFFAGMALDEAMWEAFAEAFLALTVFGCASMILSEYRRRTRKGFVQSKGKAASLHTAHPWTKKSAAAVPSAVHSAPSNTTASNCTPQVLRAVSKESIRSEQQQRAATLSKSPDAAAVVSAIRAGKASKLPQILDAALERSLGAGSEEDMASQLLLTALRACAACHCFKDAIVAYDHMADRIGEGNASLWSVLLYTIAEAEPLVHSSTQFKNLFKTVFKNLCKQTAPSSYDFVNMVRCHAAQQDAEGLRETLGNLCTLGHSVDAYTWNRALAACGGNSVSTVDCALDLAEELATAGICAEGVDAVGYNTLMKYNARAGKIPRCFELRTEMLSKGLEASEVTYGILLDACVAAKELDRAREVFDDLCSSGLQLNVVHCTSFIKVLVSARRLDEAAGVLREMVRSPGVKPDLITYSTVVKAYADAGNVTSAMNVLEMMLAENVKPDEIIFNSVLSACCAFPMKSAYVTRTFEALVERGMKPTTTTLSILLKGFAHTDAWSMSLQVLQEAPKRFGLHPETRLYAQLIQACIKARHSKIVSDVFEAMLEAGRRRGKPADSEAVSRCLRSCVLGGDPDMAVQLRRGAQQEGIPIDAPVERMLKAAMAKKLGNRSQA